MGLVRRAPPVEAGGRVMRVAAIYDIHGNLPALEAVLDDVRSEGVDRIVVGGDVVPGPMPRESISALLDLPTPPGFVYGNGERDILALAGGEMPARVPAAFHDVMRWVANELSPEQLAELASWPPTLELEIPGLGPVLFCHATPRDDNEIFTRLTPEERLRPIFDAIDAALVICGHTHMQFDRTIGRTRVVNPGSVGTPFGDPAACWALLGPGVELRRTAYDLAAAAERLGRTGYPGLESMDILRPPPESEMLQLFETATLG